MSLVFQNLSCIETLFDEQKKAWFKRADLGRYLEIVNLKMMKIYNGVLRSRCEIFKGVSLTYPLGRSCNSHDVFVNLDTALEICIRSRKPKAVALTKFLVGKGLEKVINDKNLELEGKDLEIALLSDDVVQNRTNIRQLELDNVGLQGEIRAKDQQITHLGERFTPHAQDQGKDNVVMIFRKHSVQEVDAYHYLPYYIARIQRRKITAKRRWFVETFPNSEEIVVIDNPNAVHTFNRFEEEGHVDRFQNHFRLLDLTREHLYILGVPAQLEEA